MTRTELRSSLQASVDMLDGDPNGGRKLNPDALSDLYEALEELLSARHDLASIPENECGKPFDDALMRVELAETAGHIALAKARGETK